jgi:hypothetical protein
VVKGTLHRQGNISFETTGTLATTSDGRIRLHAQHVKAVHLPVKGLMDLLGLEIAELINTKQVSGVTAEKDDLILDPQQILPPPRIEGRVSAVRVEGNEIAQTFGQKADSSFAPDLRGNYMAYRDNELRFRQAHHAGHRYGSHRYEPGGSV